ncbi:uncharacterized protein [Parasteatoda tepidariorum]|uniref:uncharacterized protein n=1 Tax=Parasteatoda tepidariorum TaxID=114398 RepID=UPI001C72030C|nr:uncharacterized protein LOC110281898 [Parasteatoda tepidariorum]
MKSFWLDINTTNWGALHEIAHGHELTGIGDETLSVTEVWNNILCFFYQAIAFGKNMSWEGSKQREMDLTEILRKGNEVEKWDLIPKLSFLTHMFFKVGRKSITRFYELNREEFDGRPFYASGTFLIEKLMHFFAVEFAVDVHPFMKLVKAVIQEEELYEHYYVLSSVAYPLNYIISDAKEMQNVYNNLGLLHLTSLVTPSDLSSTELKNDFTVNIDNQIFGVLSGNTLKLMDGSQTVTEQTILSQNITFKDVPIGVYKIFIEPNTKNAKLAYNDFYGIVHANKPNKLLLSAKEMKKPSLPTDKIKFLAYKEEEFATLTANPLKKLLKFRFYKAYPNGFFKSQIYVSIVVKNQKNEVIFSKVIEGTSSDTGSFDIPMEGEMQIEIFHTETPTHLKFDDPMMDNNK